MSHTTEVKSVLMTDAKAIEATVAELQKLGVKCLLLRDARPRMYYQDQYKTNCAYVLKLEGCPYDIGFDKYEHDLGNGKTTTAYKMVFDEWGSHIKSKVGSVCHIEDAGKSINHVGMVTQLYSKHAAFNAAKKAGWPVRSVKVNDNGEIQLIFEKRR